MKLQHVTLYITLHLLQSEAQFAAMPYPQPMPMPAMPMSMPMPMMGPPRMPMVVMPYHSRAADNFRKKRTQRPRQYSSSSDSRSSSSESTSGSSTSSSDESSSGETIDFRSKKRQVLTPVVSYVTKDGYVVYQKKIKKERAKDWLDLGKGSGIDEEKGDKDSDNEVEMSLKKKLAKMKKRHRSKGSKKSKHKRRRI